MEFLNISFLLLDTKYNIFYFLIIIALACVPTSNNLLQYSLVGTQAKAKIENIVLILINCFFYLRKNKRKS
ncbi:MAG: hypothetical protein EAZ44_04585 [Cytophagia bacterium]|nr:MAG: hypothetical protein EAZ44_04585 [Cytophagia bacterium]